MKSDHDLGLNFEELVSNLKELYDKHKVLSDNAQTVEPTISDRLLWEEFISNSDELIEKTDAIKLAIPNANLCGVADELILFGNDELFALAMQYVWFRVRMRNLLRSLCKIDSDNMDALIELLDSTATIAEINTYIEEQTHSALTFQQYVIANLPHTLPSFRNSNPFIQITFKNNWTLTFLEKKLRSLSIDFIKKSFAPNSLARWLFAVPKLCKCKTATQMFHRVRRKYNLSSLIQAYCYSNDIDIVDTDNFFCGNNSDNLLTEVELFQLIAKECPDLAKQFINFGYDHPYGLPRPNIESINDNTYERLKELSTKIAEVETKLAFATVGMNINDVYKNCIGLPARSIITNYVLKEYYGHSDVYGTLELNWGQQIDKFH